MTGAVRPETLTRSLQMCEAKRAELIARGYTARMAESAVTRGRNEALHWASYLNEAIRDQGYLDILRREMEQTEGWCRGNVDKLGQR